MSLGKTKPSVSGGEKFSVLSGQFIFAFEKLNLLALMLLCVT